MQLCVIFSDMSVVTLDVTPSTSIAQIREACVAHRRKRGYLTIGGVKLKEAKRIADYDGVLQVRFPTLYRPASRADRESGTGAG